MNDRTSSSSHLMSGGRFPVLRTITVLYLIGAAVSLIVGIVAIIYALAGGFGASTYRWATAGYLVGGTFITCIGFLAIAEVLKLFMDIARDVRSMSVARPAMAESTVVMPSRASPDVVITTDGRTNRMQPYLDEETAEGALLRGH